MKKKFLFGIAMVLAFAVQAQTDTLRVKTSAVCDDCKERIEHDLSFEKGVKSVAVDIDTKMATVVYNSAKTDPDKIRLAITKIGYDADSSKADLKAFNKLPECCKSRHSH